MVEVLLKLRTSFADWKPEEMVTVADSMLVSSASVMEREESMTVAPSPSVKGRVPPALLMTGAAFTVTVMPLPVRSELLTVASAPGTQRSAAAML